MLRKNRMEAIRAGIRWGLRTANAFGTSEGILNGAPPIPRKLNSRERLMQHAFDHVYEKAKQRKLASVSEQTRQQLINRQRALAISMDNKWTYYDRAIKLVTNGYRETRTK